MLFVNETYKHLKAIGATAEGAAFVRNCLTRAGLDVEAESGICSANNGVVLSDSGSKATAKQFMDVLALHRTWSRLHKDDIAV